VAAAVVWRSEAKLDGRFQREGDAEGLAFADAGGRSGDVAGSASLTYPQEISAGVSWRPRARLLTTVRLDADWVKWSDFENELGSGAPLDDVWGARLGVEHVFYNGFPMRFGIRYAPAPRDEEVATTAFTFGGGLDVGPLRADLAFEVANRRYRFPDLFDDARFGGDSHVQKDFVEENGTSAVLTLGAKFAPFGG
jgi:hypothetical protein